MRLKPNVLESATWIDPGRSSEHHEHGHNQSYKAIHAKPAHAMTRYNKRSAIQCSAARRRRADEHTSPERSPTSAKPCSLRRLAPAMINADAGGATRNPEPATRRRSKRQPARYRLLRSASRARSVAILVVASTSGGVAVLAND